MKKLHLIMPMGGGGTRFGNSDFNVPKPMILLRGKPFFYWAVRSVEKFVELDDIIFVVLKEHVENYHIDQMILNYFPNAKIHVIPQVLNGAVLTCLEGLKLVEDDNPIMFNDCDHAFICNDLYKTINKGLFNVDGSLITFRSNNPCYSYVKYNEEHDIIGTIEKVVASEDAICGAYLFKNKETFCKASAHYIEKCTYEECFVSGVYNSILDLGGIVSSFLTEDHISFGTPDEYEMSIKNERLGVFE